MEKEGVGVNYSAVLRGEESKQAHPFTLGAREGSLQPAHPQSQIPPSPRGGPATLSVAPTRALTSQPGTQVLSPEAAPAGASPPSMVENQPNTDWGL